METNEKKERICNAFLMKFRQVCCIQKNRELSPDPKESEYAEICTTIFEFGQVLEGLLARGFRNVPKSEKEIHHGPTSRGHAHEPLRASA
jgi:hypothetical protein